MDKPVASVPLLTVAMPVYNDAELLPNVLESVLNQTFDDFVFIIQDNCSTDGSWEILQKYAETDSRIVLYRNHQNLGAFRNFFKLHAMPKQTKYYCQKSSDDILDSTYFSRLIDLLENNDEMLLAYTNETDCPNSQYEYMEEDPEERALAMIRNFTYGGLWYGICRSYVWDMILPEQNLQGSDHILSFNLALEGKIGYIDECLYRRNVVLVRKRESYMDFCKQTVFSSDVKYPDIKFLEILYGHMNVIHSCPRIKDKDEFTRRVVKTLVTRFGVDVFYKEFMLLRISYWRLRFCLGKENEKDFQVWKRSKFLEELSYYLNKDWKFRWYFIFKIMQKIYHLIK